MYQPTLTVVPQQSTRARECGTESATESRDAATASSAWPTEEMPSTPLPDRIIDSHRRPNPAAMGAVAADGRPVTVPTWHLLEDVSEAIAAALSRILALIPSNLELDKPNSTAATIALKCFSILRPG
jgi:hypothetical protein